MSWSIPGGGCSSTSDHELILVGWEDQENDLTLLDGGRPTGWDIKSMLEDGELLEKATTEWKLVNIGRPYLLPNYT